ARNLAMENAERKRAENALQIMNDVLEERVALRTTELTQINQALQVEITERKKAEEQLQHDAFHDTLTDLPNRALLMDRLGQAVERAKRREDFQYALLFMDLDRFKLVNDSLGHAFGDALLCALGERLQSSLRPSDTVARIGGDEFVILVEDIKDDEDAAEIVERIQEILKVPFVLQGREVFAPASMGVVLGKPRYDHPEDALRDADIALYRAKTLGKARYELFKPELRVWAIQRLELENDLRKALENHELHLHYQPILSLVDDKVTGFEALLRWDHKQRGNIPPVDFIPIAEETGLIIPIGRWVLERACQQVMLWQNHFHCDPALTININISGKQFTQPDLIEQIQQVLQDTGLDASNLKLEITESFFMENIDFAEDILIRLRHLGVQLQIDDFGTGYSSFGYLQQFPIHTIKIDRSFINRLGASGNKTEIVGTILTLARDLGMESVAEGVETEEQLQMLKLLGCNYGQGFLISRPVEPKVVEELLAGGQVQASFTPLQVE
ncbi:MAG: EAL domain-containing protein, partial [Anaerolineaceae bacterium]|nr:EAL domain-containing protein [Anaerolineaceae bacterium]